MGQVLQAGAGQIPARQAAVKAGIPMTVPALTVNKVCLSGLDAIALADQLIRAGEFEIVVAGGMESMTNAPHLLPESARGRTSTATSTWSTRWPTTACSTPSTTSPMGESHRARTTRGSASPARSRTRSPPARHQRAAAAQKNGLFDDEIVPVEIPQRKGDPVRRHARTRASAPDTTAESLGQAAAGVRRRTARSPPASSSQISDGACAVVVMSRAKAEELGPDLAGRDRRARHGRRPGHLAARASRRNAISRRCAQGGLDAGRPRPGRDQRGVRRGRHPVDARRSASTEDIVNVNGGAIALGHPIGMSGARLVLHLALELRRRGGGLGAAALCGGGGQGDALLLRVPTPDAR